MEKEIVVEAKELQPNQPAIRENTSCVGNTAGGSAERSAGDGAGMSADMNAGRSADRSTGKKTFANKTIEEKQYLFTKIRLILSAGILVVLLVSALIVVPKIVDVANTVDSAVASASEVVDVVDANMDDILEVIGAAGGAIESIDNLAKSAQTSMDTLNGILDDLSTTTSLLAKITSIFK